MNSKVSKIVYWVATIWLSLGMTSTGIVQLLKIEQENDFLAGLGYPPYLPTLLGIWKLLGVVAVLAPKFPVLKEWAYAGFFFTTTGAIFSHAASGEGIGEMFPALLLLTLTMISWYFRPANRKAVALA